MLLRYYNGLFVGLVCLASCMSLSDGAERKQDVDEIRRCVARVVSVGTVTDRAHDDRMRAGAELAEVQPYVTGKDAELIVDLMVEELVKNGAATRLKEEFRTDAVYPVVQAACQMSDAQLLAGLLKYTRLRPNQPEAIVASRIIERAEQLRIGSGSYEVVRQGLAQDLLPKPPTDEGKRLLFQTAYGRAGFWTWVQWSDLPRERVEAIDLALSRLELLERAIRYSRDEDAARQARDLLAELAAADSWLIEAIVLRAMYVDYLYDPRVIAILEEKADPSVISKPIEGPQTFRKAHNLPVDQTISLKESRMIND